MVFHWQAKSAHKFLVASSSYLSHIFYMYFFHISFFFFSLKQKTTLD